MDYKEIKIYPILDSVQDFDVDDDTYFGDEYKEYISNSKLKLINPSEGGSPELFMKGIPFTCSDSFYFGSAIHECTLQKEKNFKVIDCVNRPTAKAGFVSDELYPYYLENDAVAIEDLKKASIKIDYYKDKLTESKIAALLDKAIPYLKARKEFESNGIDGINPIYMDEKSRIKFNSCMENLNHNVDIQRLLNPEGIMKNPYVYNEHTIIMDVECVTPTKESVTLHLKGKLDNFSIDPETNCIGLNDLKTTGHDIKDFGKYSFYKYHYFRQMAFYGWMLHLYNKANSLLTSPTISCNMLLVSTIPPFDTGIYKVNNNQIQRGVNEMSDLLKRVAYLKLYGCGNYPR